MQRKGAPSRRFKEFLGSHGLWHNDIFLKSSLCHRRLDERAIWLNFVVAKMIRWKNGATTIKKSTRLEYRIRLC
jgi:hypothetical protein